MEDLRLKSIIDAKMQLERVFFKQHLYTYHIPEGLNQTHMLTLLSLHFHTSCAMVELSRHLNLEKGSFTPVANKLIKLGYIEKRENSEDKRVSLLFLTAKGSSLASDFLKSHMQYIQNLLATLGKKEEEKFLQAVGAINETLEFLGFQKEH
jgi:DNA-binding MarR family transcriptional regulator